MDRLEMKNPDPLGRAQAYASIAASIAIPLILGISGYFLQNSLSTDDLKKEYVQIAITVLKENPNTQDESLRAWALDILGENSPVPFSQEVRASLATVASLSKLPTAIAPKNCMQEPHQLNINKLLEKLTNVDMLTTEDYTSTLNALITEAHNAEKNTIYFKCLRESILSYERILGVEGAEAN